MPAKPPLDLKAPRRKRRLRKWFLGHGGKRDDIPRGLRIRTRRVGEPARLLIKQVQRMAELPVSGQFDEATLRLLFPPSARKRLLAIIVSELGTHEWPAGSNWGPVKKFLAAVGIHSGAPWCLAFVVWCLGKLGYKGPLPPLPGYAPSWEAWAKAKHITKPVTLARRGDIILWDWERDGRPNHGSFCTGGIINKLLVGIDGNVGANGGTVTRTSRSISLVCCCIDLDKLLALQKS